MQTSTSPFKFKLIDNINQALEQLTKDPVTDYMVSLNHNPDEGWRIILPYDYRGSILEHKYISYSRLVEKPYFAKIGSENEVSEVQSRNHDLRPEYDYILTRSLCKIPT